jgi:hypothetical protein
LKHRPADQASTASQKSHTKRVRPLLSPPPFASRPGRELRQQWFGFAQSSVRGCGNAGRGGLLRGAAALPADAFHVAPWNRWISPAIAGRAVGDALSAHTELKVSGLRARAP